MSRDAMDRRTMIGAGVGAGAALAATAATAAGPRTAAPAAGSGEARGVSAADLGVLPNADRDLTDKLQQAIDRLAPTGTPLWLPPGRYRTGKLTLKPGTRLQGVAGASVLELRGAGPLLQADTAGDLAIDGLVLDGLGAALPGGRSGGLVVLRDVPRLTISAVAVRRSASHGISLQRASGCIADCTVEDAGETAIFSLDALGLEITRNRIVDARNNGIQVWRTSPGEDGTLVSANRIERVMAAAGGSGQNGNGINVFRAGGVLVSGNRITDCAYTAVRGNSASNIQILANSCQRLGEVALYAEFAFEGAIIASNIVDTAAAGISVTNFNEGGRLAVVQGNLIRNLSRREHEPDDKRGEGIAVEADSVVTGNVVENAATAGLFIGWTHWMREVVATGNLIRNSRIGIGVTADPAAGLVLISNNMITGARDGAIRGMQRSVAVGPDLARVRIDSPRISISGNVAS